MTTLGLIVNPVAGLGGPVGLKGTDGPEAAAVAVERGAVPRAVDRATAALSTLARRLPRLRMVTAAGELGETAAARAGVPAEVVYRPNRPGATTAADTVAAARAMRETDVILFAGGDGTARDLMAVVGGHVVVGIPAGVKMHSAVFAVNARAAGDVAAAYLSGDTNAEYAEVLDRVEADGRRRVALFGRLRVPTAPAKVARGKLGASTGGDDPAGLAAWLAETRVVGGVDVFGPGTTIAAVLAQLGVTAEPTGVTVVSAGSGGGTADHSRGSGGGADGGSYPTRSAAVDADAATVERLTRDRPVRVVVSPIGGQGFLLGRGNQQLTPTVLRRAGRAGLVIISGEAKLAALGGRPLLVDTGDDEVDRILSGYTAVRATAGRRTMYRIGAP